MICYVTGKLVTLFRCLSANKDHRRWGDRVSGNRLFREMAKLVVDEDKEYAFQCVNLPVYHMYVLLYLHMSCYIFICLAISSYVLLYLPMSCYIFLCLTIFSNVLLYLPMSCYIFLCLAISSYVFLDLLLSWYVFLRLDMSSWVFLVVLLCLAVFLDLPISPNDLLFHSRYSYVLLYIALTY